MNYISGLKTILRTTFEVLEDSSKIKDYFRILLRTFGICALVLFRAATQTYLKKLSHLLGTFYNVELKVYINRYNFVGNV